MPQRMNRARNSTPSGYQAGSDYIPTRVKGGTGTNTSGPPSNMTVGIADTAVTKGSYGDSTHVATFTVNEQGQLTDAKNTAIAFPADTGITQLTGDGTAGPGSGSQKLTLATVNKTTGTFGDTTHVAQVTVNALGLVTAASAVAITFPVGSVTFGTGAPGGTPAAGDLYFDDTLATYSGYVGRSGAWHKFS